MNLFIIQVLLPVLPHVLHVLGGLDEPRHHLQLEVPPDEQGDESPSGLLGELNVIK